MIHSPRAERSVEIIPLNTPGYIEEYAGARRYYLKNRGGFQMKKVVRYSLVSTLFVSSILVGCAKEKQRQSRKMRSITVTRNG